MYPKLPKRHSFALQPRSDTTNQFLVVTRKVKTIFSLPTPININV